MKDGCKKTKHNVVFREKKDKKKKPQPALPERCPNLPRQIAALAVANLAEETAERREKKD